MRKKEIKPKYLVVEYKAIDKWEIDYDDPEKMIEKLVQYVLKYEDVKCSATDEYGNEIKII